MALVFQKDTIWNCHCCTAKNTGDRTTCRVCGRPENYAQPGYILPFHGNNAKIYRPSQLINVLEDIHEADSERWTALHSACAHGNIGIVRQLLQFKAQIEALTEKGHTALHLAVYSGSADCVTELLKNHARVNVVTYSEKVTPLHMACERGYARIAQQLIQAGADIRAVNILGRNALHCAAVAGRTDIALLLLKVGTDLHAVDAHGWEACQIAELYDHRELEELLIREGMTEKQAIIKDLPPMKWHSDIWFEVVKSQTQRRIDFQKDQIKLQENERKLNALIPKEKRY